MKTDSTNSTKTQILPGIRRIGTIDSRALPSVVPLRAICGGKIPVLTAVTWIRFYGTPECQCRTERHEGGILQTATLKFLSPAMLYSSHRSSSFIVEDTTGERYLIGQREAPLPTITCEYTTGAPTGTPAGFSYEITHTALRSMVPCITP